MIEPLSNDAPASELHQPFRDFYQLLEREVSGLTTEQLDFRSDQWEWADWSIRRQVSHIASLHFRWMLLRWGEQLFPGGPPAGLNTAGLLEPPEVRWLDEEMFWELEDLLPKVREAFDLLGSVLEGRTMKELRELEITREMPGGLVGQWQQMIQAHPTGIYFDSENPALSHMTLEGTVRHMYFEDVTHLYNIQRLRKAQGLPPVVEVPHVGYWQVADWDRSEP
ncbi:MAG: hypothetical protein ACE5Q6_08390 [Dehalococcoidia bacterium]